VAVVNFNLQLVASPNPVFSGSTVQITATASTNFAVVSWTPARLFNGNFSPRPTIVADSTTTIMVKARSSNGCVDSAQITLLVDPMDDIYLPSAFTPNGDGRNDVFKVLGGAFSSFDLKIFNRWGQMVFATTDRSRGWDGRMNGTEQPAQVYVYVLSGKLKNGTSISRKGTVMLVR
jgi:gliding motility-associated-like protein